MYVDHFLSLTKASILVILSTRITVFRSTNCSSDYIRFMQSALAEGVFLSKICITSKLTSKLIWVSYWCLS